MSELFIALTLVYAMQVALLCLHTVEHFRFHRRRLTKPIDTTWSPRVTLFVPCKGLELKLTDHLQALFDQRYPQYELCFIVESEADPVLPVISMLQSQNRHIPSRVVIAGVAHGCGQKVHNLIQATRTVSPETEVLAFVDSDAHPHTDWLWRLVGRLGSDDKNGVSSGYRWYSPVSNTLPNLLLTSMNALILGLLGPHQFNMAWGGAWAIRRETFLKLGLPGAWEGTLSDDLTITRIVNAANLRVAFEPHCLTTSPADMTLSQLVEFARRQYKIVRVYAPRWWWASFAAGALIQCGLWGLAGLAVMRLATGGDWLVPAVLTAGYYAFLSVRCWAFIASVSPYLKTDPRQVRQIQWLMLGFAPLVMLFNWLLVASAIAGRTIVWRGIGYRLDSPTRTTVLFRPESKPATAKPATVKPASNPAA